MARSNDFWFEFNGVKSTDLGVRLTDGHAFSRGERRGGRAEISGRDGDVWLDDGATNGFEIERSCLAPASGLRRIAAWLSGSGRLRFSGEQSAMYDARIDGQIDFRRVAAGKDPLCEFSVRFDCQPFPRIWPEPEPVEISESGAELDNPGTAPSRPRIEIEGSGSFSLTIGKQTMFFSNVDGGIIVDSELMDALTPDGSLLANDKIDGKFFEIQPGQNVVQWLEGGEDDEGAPLTGSVSKVTIAPRWRWM